MADQDPPRQKYSYLAHFPTCLLIIGYVMFWVEMFFIRQNNGRTTWAAACLAAGFLILFFLRERGRIRRFIEAAFRAFGECGILKQCFVLLALCLCGVILLTGFNASLLPPHLVQEEDLMNYRIALPRQHLILGSFSHIPWSSVDFYYMPLDFALSSYWLCTDLPNKFPQFLFVVGLISMVLKLAFRLSGGQKFAGMLAVFGVIGSHGIGIQIGTGMMDLISCYLVLAAAESFWGRKYVLSAVEFAFYFWSKSFHPPMLIIIAVIMAVIIVLRGGSAPIRQFWVQNQPRMKIFLASFVLASLLIGGPFFIKSWFYTGTPAFPFGVGILPRGAYLGDDPMWEKIKEKAEEIGTIKDGYGHGRSPAAFLMHLWLISVPEKGVNNSYDYPVGLVYLLCVGPFFYLCARNLKSRALDPALTGIVAFWIVWWFTSQQSRFLFVPIILMIIVVLCQREFQRPLMMFGLMIALMFTALSVVRAHRADWGRTAYEVLRDKDKRFLAIAAEYDGKGPVKVFDNDVAFASFPVDVHKKSILTLR